VSAAPRARKTGGEDGGRGPNVSAVLLSIQVGLPRQITDERDDHPWVTGFFKEPVQGRVFVGRTNLAGDGQADLRNHGGPDKAVLAYAAGAYAYWRADPGLAGIPYGAFGENLTLGGCDETTVCVGDAWQIGDAVLQISQPRQPCWKLARRWGIDDLPARVIETGRSGWYFRVLTEGHIEAGQTATLLERPYGEWTIAACNDVLYRRSGGGNTDDLALSRCPLLSDGWRRYLARRAASGED
jgi:MOSC domain-containing protein YiiM